MRRGMETTRALTVRHYAARIIDINDYLASFPGATLNDKISVTELNETLLKNMPTIWSIQAYVQGFGYESITFKKSVNIFERTEISKSIYEGVL